MANSLFAGENQARRPGLRLIDADWPRPSRAATRPTTLTLLPDKQARTVRVVEMTLAGLAGLIQATHAATKDDLPWLKLARFGDGLSDKGSLRHNANVLAVNGAEGDYDGEVMAFDEACEIAQQAGVLALIYTSPSYTPEKPRWRVLCPFSVGLAPDQRNRMMARVNGAFGGVLANESHILSQSYYYGSVGDSPPPRVEIIDGTPIDLRDDLDATAIGKSAARKARDGEAAARDREATATGAAIVPFEIPGTPPAVLTARLSGMTAAAQVGIQHSWFDSLAADQKNEVLRAIATHPEFIKLADQSRTRTGPNGSRCYSRWPMQRRAEPPKLARSRSHGP